MNPDLDQDFNLTIEFEKDPLLTTETESYDRAKPCFRINPTAEIVAYTLKIKHFWPKI